MEGSEIRAVVLDTLKTIAPEIDAGKLQPDRPLRTQVELDSMDSLNFVIALQERLRLSIPESDYGKLGTLQAIISYLEAKLR